MDENRRLRRALGRTARRRRHHFAGRFVRRTGCDHPRIVSTSGRANNQIPAISKFPVRLYNPAIATMEVDPTKAYNQDGATRFIRLNALRLKVAVRVQRRTSATPMIFKPERLKAWKDIHKYSKHGWLFRGQREADWELESSFERCCQRHNVKPGKRPELERRLFREFRRTYTLYAKHTPLSNSIIEWLSLMQHYGAPTRLLDFTYSIYVAAYFATEEADGESAVWALDAKWVRERAHSLLGAAGKNGTFFDSMPKGKPFEQRDEEPASKLFLEAPYARACWPINGFSLNERLIIQRGAFLVCGDIRHSFMDNIIPLMEPGADAHVLKIVIPRKVGRQAIKELFSMGISRTSLFPGLDGFSRSLGVWHSAFEPTKWGFSPRALR